MTPAEDQTRILLIQRSRIADLENTVERLRAEMGALEAENERLHQDTTALKRQLEAVEQVLLGG